MPPNNQSEVIEYEGLEKNTLYTKKVATRRPVEIVWRNVVFHIIIHAIAAYGLYAAITTAKWQTSLLAFVISYTSLFGLTAGVHRLWSHKTFKANLPIRVLLLTLYTITMQGSAYGWVRDHRTHHKFSETDGDPYNAQRGFFFSHIGWVLTRRHPDVFKKGKTMDFSDLQNDKLLQFQKKYYFPLALTSGLLLPVYVPMAFWGETFVNSFAINMLRYCYILNLSLSINSISHRFGYRPYDLSTNATESGIMSFLAIGEAWHNYHHAFPWDYKTAEFGYLNLTKSVLDYFAKKGWIYDLKTASPELVEKCKKKVSDFEKMEKTQ